MDAQTQQLQNTLFNRNVERTTIDKLLGKEDISRIREIIKKENLTRQDIREINSMLASSESKIVNLSEWDRYVVMKYYVWIQQMIVVGELLIDYKNQKIEQTEQVKKSKKFSTFTPTAKTKQMYKNIQLQWEHNLKFMINLYLNIMRTSLSLGGSGFKELLTNKFEGIYSYPNQQTLPQQPGVRVGFGGGNK